MEKRYWKAHALLVAAAGIYSGYNVVLAGVLSTKVSVTGLSLMREMVAVPLLYAWAWRAGQLNCWPNEDIRFLMLGCTLAAFQLCFAIGVSLTDASTAAIFQCVEPSTAAVVGAACGERCGRDKWISALLAGAGVAVLLQVDVTTSSIAQQAVGCLMLFSQGIGIACYCLLQKTLVRGGGERRPKVVGAIAVTAHAYLVSLVIMATAAGMSTALSLENPPPYTRRGVSALISPSTLAVVAYSAIFSSVLGYTMRAEANKTVDASTLVLYNALQPPLTAAINKFLHPRTAIFGLSESISTLLVIAAVLIAGFAEKRRAAQYEANKHDRSEVEPEGAWEETREESTRNALLLESKRQED